MSERRQTHLPKDEPLPTERLVFGRDIPCSSCKGKGTRFDAKTQEPRPCWGCNGKGYRSKKEEEG